MFKALWLAALVSSCNFNFCASILGILVAQLYAEWTKGENTNSTTYEEETPEVTETLMLRFYVGSSINTSTMRQPFIVNSLEFTIFK